MSEEPPDRQKGSLELNLENISAQNIVLKGEYSLSVLDIANKTAVAYSRSYDGTVSQHSRDYSSSLNFARKNFHDDTERILKDTEITASRKRINGLGEITFMTCVNEIGIINLINELKTPSQGTSVKHFEDEAH